MKNKFYILTIMLGLLYTSCEYDPNQGVDYISPKAQIDTDTIEILRGQSIDIKAIIKDPSGISHISLSYPEWKIDNEIIFESNDYFNEYTYSYTVQVPSDAKLEWIEDYYKHDGTLFKIKQQYHKLALTCFDGVRNKNTFYFYIKAK